MTGDFNEGGVTGGTVYDKLVTNGPLVDTWDTAKARGPLFGTFHNYLPWVPNGTKIDWILSSPGVHTRTSIVNTYSEQGQFPSDHFPVQAVVTLPLENHK